MSQLIKKLLTVRQGFLTWIGFACLILAYPLEASAKIEGNDGPQESPSESWKESWLQHFARLEAQLARNPGNVLAGADRLAGAARGDAELLHRLFYLEARALLQRGRSEDTLAALKKIQLIVNADVIPDRSIASLALILQANEQLQTPSTWSQAMQAAQSAERQAEQCLEQLPPSANKNRVAFVRHLAVRARRSQALLYHLQGHTQKAISLLERIQVEDSSFFKQGGRFVTANDRLEANRTDRLCGILKQQGEPTFPSWTGPLPMFEFGEKKQLADLWFALGDWPRALTAYTALEEESRVRGNAQLMEWCLLQKARSLAATNNGEDAMKLYERFLTKHSRSLFASAALLRAGVLSAGPLSDIPRAQSLFNALVKRYPNTPEAEKAAYYLAILELEANQWSSARKHFEKFLRTYPQSSLCRIIEEEHLPKSLAKGSIPAAP